MYIAVGTNRADNKKTSQSESIGKYRKIVLEMKSLAGYFHPSSKRERREKERGSDATRPGSDNLREFVPDQRLGS